MVGAAGRWRSRLGEEFYKRNLERLRELQKIEVLYALKYRRQLDPDAEAHTRVGRLFELRNRFVHPKTRAVADREDRGDDARERLDEMTPEDLRKAFWSVTSLFAAAGVGAENEQGETTNNCLQKAPGKLDGTSTEDIQSP